jgi:hypothetical protein
MVAECLPGWDEIMAQGSREGRIVIGVACAWCSLLTVIGHGQTTSQRDGNAAASNEASSRLFDYFDRQAEQFEIRNPRNEPLRTSGDALLKWTIGSSWQGSYFVWTDQQRPAVIGCFLADTQTPDYRRSIVELHTIGPARIAPLELQGVRKQTWAPDGRRSGDFDWSGGPPMSAEARQRLRVYRDVAREFSVTMFNDDERSKEILRLLSQPLYRYPAIDGRSDDGAIFAFVTTNGTDPEFLLALETTGSAVDTSWTIRPMRSCTRRLELRHRDKLAWQVDPYDLKASPQSSTDPYIITTLLDTSVDEFTQTVDRTLAAPE